MFWSTAGGEMEMFPVTITLRRFCFLIRNMRLDDIKTREERKNQNKFTPVREIIKTVENNCQKHYTVAQYITIHEMLLIFYI